MGKVSEWVKSNKAAVSLIAILILAFAIRFIPYSQEGFLDSDMYVHYSVVEQALEKGTFPLENALDGCPQGIKATHPIGFYFFPWLMGHFLSLKFAFAFSSAAFGVLTILLIYFLFKKALGKRTALIGVLFLAVSFGHIYRSNSAFFRGENFVLVPLLLSLIFALDFLAEEKKLKYAILAGIASASSVLFWPGYVYALIVFSLSLIFFITWDFIKGNEISRNINFGVLAILIAAASTFILAYLANAPSVISNSFLLMTFILPAVFLFCLKIFRKATNKNKIWFLTGTGVLLLVVGFLMSGYLMSVLEGFGFIKPASAFYKNLHELNHITLKVLFDYLWILPVFSLSGLVLLFRRFKTDFDSKKAFLFCSILISAYLCITTIRFVFLAGIFIIPMTGIFFDWLINARKKLGYVILAVLFLSAAWHGISMIRDARYPVSPDTILSLEYFGNNTEKGACLATIPDSGGLVQYYARRASYISSTNQNIERFGWLEGFFFSNSSFGIAKGRYAGLMPEDFTKLNTLIQLSGAEGLEFNFIGLVGNAKDVNFEQNDYSSFNGQNFSMRFYNNGSIEAKTLRNGKPVFIETLYVEFNDKVYKTVKEDAGDDGCIYVGRTAAAYFNNKLCNLNIVKMLAQEKIPGLELWYSKGSARIYKSIS